MNLCTVFQLNIWRNNTQCTFQLTWGERQQINATLDYPSELDRLYENWQTAYLRAYESPLRGRVSDEMSFTPPDDWKNRSMQAETALLQKFQNWLGGYELQEIKQRILSEVTGKLATGNNCCVELLIASKADELIRLPWEAWNIVPPDSSLVAAIRICRTLMTVEEESLEALSIAPKRGKTRILVILAADTELRLQEDRKALKPLLKARVAEVEIVGFKLEQSADEIRSQFLEKLIDDRGWDALIFGGHSDETDLTGGQIKLASNVIISMTEIETQLRQAKNQGLKVAIFNSCRGNRLAEFLIGKIGLNQVVSMRERIHDRVAHVFSEQLCDSLAKYHTIQQAVVDACQYLAKEKSAYPSAYLVPSLFRHPAPQVTLFQIERYGWKRVWQDWRLTRKETVVLTGLLFLNLLIPVQDLFIETRIFVQASYRDITGQIPEQKEPQVVFISIDQDSVYEADKNDNTFNAMPMDRGYLAQLVTRLTEFKVKVIGLNYRLDSREDFQKEKQLGEAIQLAVRNHQTRFVLATDKEISDIMKIPESIASENWSFKGFTNFRSWDIKFPERLTCDRAAKDCPFAYLLALLSLLSQDKHSNQVLTPQLNSQQNFQDSLSQYLQQAGKKDSQINALFQAANPPFKLRSMLDFSIPPSQAYIYLPAKELFSKSMNQNLLQKKITIIGAGDYLENPYQYSMPLALTYWCRWSFFKNKQDSDSFKKCRDKFYPPEAHAYMIHHFLTPHQVLLIPGSLMILFALFLGKGLGLKLLEKQYKDRKKFQGILRLATVTYGIIGLQTYISGLLLIPLILPSCMFWLSIQPVFRKKVYD